MRQRVKSSHSMPAWYHHAEQLSVLHKNIQRVHHRCYLVYTNLNVLCYERAITLDIVHMKLSRQTIQ